MFLESDREGPGLELRSLVADWSRCAASFRKVSTLGAPRHKAAAYRVSLSDGRSVKGRELRDEQAAERMAYVLSRVRHPAFPRILARRGRAVLLEWIDGSCPGDRSPNSEQIEAAAELLGFLHGFVVPAGCPIRGADPAAAFHEGVLRHLRRLVESGSITAELGGALVERLVATRPEAPELGFVHGDLCGENLVVEPCGRLRVIDNEAAAVGLCDADLARTLYRWSLRPDESDRFLEAYARHRSCDGLRQGFLYWALAVRLASAAHRVGASPKIVNVPLRSLGEIMRSFRLPEGELLVVH